MKNYRKAKTNEIKCQDCGKSSIRWWSGRLECRSGGVGVSYCCKKTNTCDYARPKRKN